MATNQTDKNDNQNQIINLSFSRSTTFDWIIYNYPDQNINGKKYSTGQFISSKEIVGHSLLGCQFHLILWPNGCNEDNEEYVSLKLHRLMTDFGPEEFRVSLTATIFSPELVEAGSLLSFTNIPFSKGRREGISRLIPIKELENLMATWSNKDLRIHCVFSVPDEQDCVKLQR